MYIRAGKNLPVTCTEVRVELHRPPQRVFAEYEELPHDTNYLRFRLNPQVQIALGARAKTPGEGFVGKPIELALSDDHPGDERRTSGCSAMRWTARTLLFAREDGVEKAWRVVDHGATTTTRRSPTSRTRGVRNRRRGLFDGNNGWQDPHPFELHPREGGS